MDGPGGCQLFAFLKICVLSHINRSTEVREHGKPDMRYTGQRHFDGGVHVMGAVERDAAVVGIVVEDFQKRMEAQCDEIRQYRLAVRREQGRELTMEQAAREWIEIYAGAFARDNDPG